MLLIGIVFLSGCTGNAQSISPNQEAEVVVLETTVTEPTAAPEESTEPVTEVPTETMKVTETVSSKYVPLWPAGTLLSDSEGIGWGLITKVDLENSEYYFRNVMHPEWGEPYIIKDSSYEEMGTKYSAKGIDNKYIIYEGKAIKIPITTKTGSSIVGYLEYDTKETMKHTVGE